MKSLRKDILRTVLVTTSAGAFKGTLLKADQDFLTLEHASAVGASGSGPLDGRVLIPAASIVWMQVV